MKCNKCGGESFTELTKNPSKKEEHNQIVSKIILCNNCEPLAKSILECFREKAYETYIELITKRE